MTRLDDLFGYEDAPKRSMSRRPVVRWIGMLVGVFVLSYVIHALLWVHHDGPPFVLVFATVAAFAALRHTLRVLDVQPIPRTLRGNPPVDQRSESADDGMRNAASSWNMRLDYAQDEPRHFERIIRPAFIEIIDERIRLGHGVTREADPERFREIVGPQLWKFMTEPVPRRMTPQMIAAVVAQMEEL
jgi:hypothetical protein